MAGRVRTTDRDRGFKKIISNLKKGADSKVSIGWFPDAKHEGLQTAEVATFSEYGDRPMIAPVVDKNGLAYRAEIRRRWDDVLTGRLTVEGALTVFGARVNADLKDWITSGPHKPNAESTIAAKGSSRPLIDSGTMRDQVLHRVTLK